MPLNSEDPDVSDLFSKPDDPAITNSKTCRDLPDARGVYKNTEKTFVAFINEKEHLKLISREGGCNLQNTFKCLANGLKMVEKI